MSPRRSILGPMLSVLLAVPGAALAGGDAAVGEKEFSKCKACHSIIAADGSAVVKGGKVGPNLFGVIGRPAASLPGFKYGPSILAAGAKGLVWDEALLSTYVQDPTAFLKDYLGDDAAKSKMTFKMAKKSEDVAAYLASLAAAP